MKCENKIRLNAFLEHYLKDTTPEEMKESLKRMPSKPKSRLITLVESRNRLKNKG